MKTLPAYARAARALPALLTETFNTDYNPALPLVYALGLLTGLPYYPATVPVVITACEAGLAIWDINGYYVGGYAPTVAGSLTPNGVDPESSDDEAYTLAATLTYGGAVTLLNALPTRLTYSALTAIGFDFNYGVTPDSRATPPVAVPGVTLGVTPNGESFTVTSPYYGVADYPLGVAALGATGYVAAYAPATGYATPNAGN